MSEWQPTDTEIRVGQESYIRYLGWVCYLNNPYNPQLEAAAGQMADEHPEASLVFAETEIYKGLQEVIRVANGLDCVDLREVESRYAEALPNMFKIVDSTFEVHALRLHHINSALELYRPAPFLSRITYHSICHGNRHRLHTPELLGGLVPAPVFRPLLVNRTLQKAKIS